MDAFQANALVGTTNGFLRLGQMFRTFELPELGMPAWRVDWWTDYVKTVETLEEQIDAHRKESFRQTRTDRADQRRQTLRSAKGRR
jgi:hypothetical protein